MLIIITDQFFSKYNPIQLAWHKGEYTNETHYVDLMNENRNSENIRFTAERNYNESVHNADRVNRDIVRLSAMLHADKDIQKTQLEVDAAQSDYTACEKAVDKAQGSYDKCQAMLKEATENLNTQTAKAAESIFSAIKRHCKQCHGPHTHRACD